MISSFQELIAPLTQAEFRTILCARVLTFRRGSGENRFAGLFDWNSFRRVNREGSTLMRAAPRPIS